MNLRKYISALAAWDPVPEERTYKTIPIDSHDETDSGYELVEWNFSEFQLPAARNAARPGVHRIHAVTEILSGLTLYASPAAGVDMVEVDKSADGFRFTRELRFCGTGYPFGNSADSLPVRSLRFDVRRKCRIMVYAASAAGGFSLPFVLHCVDLRSQQIFWTGTAYCSANFPTRMEFNYDGPAGEMLVMGGSGAMNIWYIRVEYGEAPADMTLLDAKTLRVTTLDIPSARVAPYEVPSADTLPAEAASVDLSRIPRRSAKYDAD